MSGLCVEIFSYTVPISNEFLFFWTLCFDRVQCLVRGRKEGCEEEDAVAYSVSFQLFLLSLRLVVMMYERIEWNHGPLLDMISFREGFSMWDFIPESSIYPW